MQEEPFAPIVTPRFRLRCPIPADAPALSALMTGSVSEGLASWPVPYTPSMALERIVQARHAAGVGTALPCAIILQESSVLAGWAALNRVEDEPHRGELSYWVGADYQGQGYAAEAVAALLRAGFNRLGMSMIEAGAQLANMASFAVMRACFMSRADERLVYAPSRGRDEPCLFYRLSRADAARLGLI